MKYRQGKHFCEMFGDMPTIDTRTVDTTIQRLRSKIGKAANHIETIRGIGYRYLESL